MQLYFLPSLQDLENSHYAIHAGVTTWSKHTVQALAVLF